MSKILVTGGTGLVGKALQEIMPDALYLSSTDFDLTKEIDVYTMYKKYTPDIVIHLAAKVGGIQDNISDPVAYIEANTLMNTLLLKYANINKVERFIGILSTCVYPDVSEAYPLKETQLHDGIPTPTNFGYAVSKRTMAAQIDAYRKQYNCNYSYLIPCNLMGEHDKYDEKRSHFLGAVIKKIYDAKKNGENKITLFGTGKPIRQFMYAGDLARVIKECIDSKISANMNVCGDESYTIDELARLAMIACGAPNIEIEYDNTKPDGQYRKDADNSLLKRNLPSFVFTPLINSIEKTYDHFSKQLNK